MPAQGAHHLLPLEFSCLLPQVFPAYNSVIQKALFLFFPSLLEHFYHREKLHLHSDLFFQNNLVKLQRIDSKRSVGEYYIIKP